MQTPEPAALNGGARQRSVADEVADVPLRDGQCLGGLGDGQPLAQSGIELRTGAIPRDCVLYIAPAVHRVRKRGGDGLERVEPC